MITLLPVMQRACLCYYTIITYYYVIITPGSIITHYYLFQSPELADVRYRIERIRSNAKLGSKYSSEAGDSKP